MNPKLHAYLDLERLMLFFDGNQDSRAEMIRDLMDTLWYELTDADHAILDARELRGVEDVEHIRIHVGEGFFAPPPEFLKCGDPAEKIPAERVVA